MRITHNETIRMKKAPVRESQITSGGLFEREYSYSRSIRDQIQMDEKLPPVVQQTSLFSVDPETVWTVILFFILMFLGHTCCSCFGRPWRYLRSRFFSKFPFQLRWILWNKIKFNHFRFSTFFVAFYELSLVLRIPILEHPTVSDVLNLGSSYTALVTDKAGQRSFNINSFALPSHEEEKDVGLAIQNFLNDRSPGVIEVLYKRVSADIIRVWMVSSRGSWIPNWVR